MFPLSIILSALASAGETTDPLLWLESVDGDQALEWVRGQNEVSGADLASRDGFEALEASLLAVYDSDDRIPYVRQRGDYLYNFWRDAAHPKGILRRTTLASYREAEPEWEVILEVDALAEAEDENWVWHGMQCLPPAHRRCLISLSRGGADASVVREFDLEDRQFVEGGFVLPEAKSSVGWIDLDNLYVGTDFGEGSLTESGYPRTIRRWRRGTPFDSGETVIEGDVADVSVFAWHDHHPDYPRDFVGRGLTFYTNALFTLQRGAWTRVDKPDSANARIHGRWMYIELRDDWELDGVTYTSGSLLVTDFDRWMKGKRKLEVLFAPTERSSLAGLTMTANHVMLNVLDNVRSRIEVHTPGKKGWTRSELPGVLQNGAVWVAAVDANHSDAYWLGASDYVTPSLYAYGEIGGGEPDVLRRLEPQYDASGLSITQHEATSEDGTKVPYFQVSRDGVEGPAPTLLYGYGGFEISLLPHYSGTVGRGWLERGGVYVVANIRGGGEFGPRWHQAALKEKRHRAYEDFASVAEDLVRRQITTPKQLGAMGGSNGGLLMGNMYTLRPDLWGAIVCQVPLLDMQRYHLLLAGASWVGEYGDPDDPEQWAFIKTFSPYHNIDAEAEHPPILFTTSTRDDRVHPGHARKMAARLLELNKDVLYYENIEGGHGGAADNAQAAHKGALAYTFLWSRLGGQEAPTE